MLPTRKQRKYRQNLLVQSGLTRQETKGLKTWEDFSDAYYLAIERALDATGQLPHLLMEDIVKRLGPFELERTSMPGTVTDITEDGIVFTLNEPVTYVTASFSVGEQCSLPRPDSEKQNGG